MVCQLVVFEAHLLGEVAVLHVRELLGVGAPLGQIEQHVWAEGLLGQVGVGECLRNA